METRLCPLGKFVKISVSTILEKVPYQFFTLCLTFSVRLLYNLSDLTFIQHVQHTLLLSYQRKLLSLFKSFQNFINHHFNLQALLIEISKNFKFPRIF